MTREQNIAALLEERQAVSDELNKRISEGSPDAEKEVLADRFNELSDALTQLGHSDA